jgi:hypothetical protein
MPALVAKALVFNWLPVAVKTYSAVAALFVHSAATTSPSAAETIAKVFRLTRTELQVMTTH